MNPQLPSQWTPLDLGLEAMAAAGLVAQLGIVLPRLPHLPGRIPVHFDFAGRPDRWGSRAEFNLLPVVSLLVFVLLTVVARLPHLANYPVAITPDNAARQYRLAMIMLTLIKAEIMWLLAFLGWKITRVAAGQASGLGRGFLFVFLGTMLGTPLVWVALTFRSR